MGVSDFSQNRPQVPKQLADRILVKSRHTCCICHTGRVTAQIHHADGDPSNNDEENLIPLCPNCHARAESEYGMTRNYSPEQLRMYRDGWFRELEGAERAAALRTVLEFSSEGAQLTPRVTGSQGEVESG